MAPHSSTLAWKILWTEELGRLQSMGSRRVRHDWVTWLSLFTFMHWRRKWQPTPVFLPGESILGMQEPGGLLSMGSHRAGHDWSDLAAAAAALCGIRRVSRDHCISSTEKSKGRGDRREKASNYFYFSSWNFHLEKEEVWEIHQREVEGDGSVCE